MANDMKPGASADDAAIEKQVFSADWVGKISYWIFHYRKPLLILFVLITILLGAMASQLRVQAAFTTTINSIAGAGDQATLFFRFVNTSTVATGGTNRVDNIFVNGTAVPAPGAIALLGLAGLAARRRR